MRNRIWTGIFAAVSGLYVVTSACSSAGDNASSSAAGGHTGDYSIGAAPGDKPGGAKGCAGFFSNATDCGTCVESSCCAELSECSKTKGCKDCLMGNPATCAANQAILTKIVACTQGKCDAVCKASAAPPPAPACDALAAAPSQGSCVTLGRKVACNPITNAGCDDAKGEACDIGPNGFQCYPGPNTVSLCEECGKDKGFCAGGLYCVGKCAKFCCDDADCGKGKCDKKFSADPELQLGICIAP